MLTSFSSLSLLSKGWNAWPKKPFGDELVEIWMTSPHLIVSCASSLAAATFIPGCSPFFWPLGHRRLASFGSVSGAWRARSSTSSVRCKSASPARIKSRQRQLRHERGMDFRFIDLRTRPSRAPRVAGGDQAVFHLMDPITGFGNDRVVRGQEQSFAAFLDDMLKQFKGALGVGSIEVAGWFVGQNDTRIIGQRARDGHPLLFASGEVAARSA